MAQKGGALSCIKHCLFLKIKALACFYCSEVLSIFKDEGI